MNKHYFPNVTLRRSFSFKCTCEKLHTKIISENDANLQVSVRTQFKKRKSAETGENITVNKDLVHGLLSSEFFWGGFREESWCFFLFSKWCHSLSCAISFTHHKPVVLPLAPCYCLALD